MAVDLKQQLDRVAAKADLIVEKYQQTVGQLKEANEIAAELRVKLDKAYAEIERLKVDNEHLTMASALTPDRKEIENVRSLLSGLVRDIDRCILDLKE